MHEVEGVHSRLYGKTSFAMSRTRRKVKSPAESSVLSELISKTAQQLFTGIVTRLGRELEHT
jgi:hypothetical protein